MNADKLHEKKVLVMGLGRFGGGLGAAGWLSDIGADVTVTDMASAEKLQDQIDKLSDKPDISFALGGHDTSLLDNCELLVVNPAIPDTAEFLTEAKKRNIPLTTEINLFIERCPAKIVGITGTVGKSTTAAMTAAALGGGFKTHLGGNIGTSLLGSLQAGEIGENDIVVLELSSFQLQRTCWIKFAPAIALVTNISENHLDWHKTFEAYKDAKKNICRFQNDSDMLILPQNDRLLDRWQNYTKAKIKKFATDLSEKYDLSVPGSHNQINAAAAMAIARAIGVDETAALEKLKKFTGLPHRLQFVTETDGVRYFNDSKATTPDGTAVALKSFESGKIVAIVGGYDKQIPLDGMCAMLAEKCHSVIATGQVGPQIARAVAQCRYVENFPDAVKAAIAAAKQGDTVVLSPGCASYGQFVNYEQRGELFCRIVNPAK